MKLASLETLAKVEHRQVQRTVKYPRLVSWKAATSNWVARNRQTRLGQWIGSTSMALARAYENDSGHSRTNGEYRILEAVAHTGITTVFDVGAHHGTWATHAAETFSTAAVHAFEIEPTNRAELTDRVGNNPRIVVVPFGLAEERGEVAVYVDEQFPDTTSMVYSHDRPVTRCLVETGDGYLAEQGLDRVDVLKVDVEGLDLAVLRGFSDALARGQVGLIQFEFTMWAAITRTWLHDFYDLLEPFGFQLGKVYPSYVDWREWHPEHEIFVRANFVALHRSRDDMRTLL